METIREKVIMGIERILDKVIVRVNTKDTYILYLFLGYILMLERVEISDLAIVIILLLILIVVPLTINSIATRSMMKKFNNNNQKGLKITEDLVISKQLNENLEYIREKLGYPVDTDLLDKEFMKEVKEHIRGYRLGTSDSSDVVKRRVSNYKNKIKLIGQDLSETELEDIQIMSRMVSNFTREGTYRDKYSLKKRRIESLLESLVLVAGLFMFLTALNLPKINVLSIDMRIYFLIIISIFVTLIVLNRFNVLNKTKQTYHQIYIMLYSQGYLKRQFNINTLIAEADRLYTRNNVVLKDRYKEIDNIDIIDIRAFRDKVILNEILKNEGLTELDLINKAIEEGQG